MIWVYHHHHCQSKGMTKYVIYLRLRFKYSELILFSPSHNLFPFQKSKGVKWRRSEEYFQTSIWCMVQKLLINTVILTRFKYQYGKQKIGRQGCGCSSSVAIYVCQHKLTLFILQMIHFHSGQQGAFWNRTKSTKAHQTLAPRTKEKWSTIYDREKRNDSRHH